jgi:UDPglucose 6-dehydrogenase
MKITIIGTGYVGLVTGACLAEMGHEVLCMDIDEKKINNLNRGKIPIYEPGLEEIIKRNVEVGKLSFTNDPEISARHGLVQFIAVGTPSDEDGSADIKYVIDAAREIARNMQEYKLIINKSTVPVGTADEVRVAVQDELNKRGKNLNFSIASNPEFLKEGAAITDFMRPDRIIIGIDDENSLKIIKKIYIPFNKHHDRMIVMDVKSAELTKYAANAMLATRISFMNELAILAEAVEADIEHVRNGIGSDTRIGYDFLYAGCGYGGSCFAKDIKALQKTAKKFGKELKIISSVEAVNENQKKLLMNKINKKFGENLQGRKFSLWGLAFKPNTDDMRDAPSRVLINALWEQGAEVNAYDPVAMKEAKRVFNNDPRLKLVDDPMDALEGTDALVILTEWKMFQTPDFEMIKIKLNNPVIFDGRNIYDPVILQESGIEYYPIGRRKIK